jgi:hypothetical protein
MDSTHLPTLAPPSIDGARAPALPRAPAPVHPTCRCRPICIPRSARPDARGFASDADLTRSPSLLPMAPSSPPWWMCDATWRSCNELACSFTGKRRRRRSTHTWASCACCPSSSTTTTPRPPPRPQSSDLMRCGRLAVHSDVDLVLLPEWMKALTAHGLLARSFVRIEGGRRVTQDTVARKMSHGCFYRSTDDRQC